MFLTTLSLALTPTCALASSGDVAATHTYLAASYTILHDTLTGWPRVEANIHQLDLKLGAECPDTAVNALQNEEAQKMSYEVAGAIWATAYHTEAGLVRRFAHTVDPLHWSSRAITRASRAYTLSLHELALLPLPNLCGDLHTWGASDFKTIPASTLQFDRHFEAIEGKAIPLRLLAPYETPADRLLALRVGRLETQFEGLETVRGSADWNMLLETLGLNQ